MTAEVIPFYEHFEATPARRRPCSATVIILPVTHMRLRNTTIPTSQRYKLPRRREHDKDSRDAR